MYILEFLKELKLFNDLPKEVDYPKEKVIYYEYVNALEAKSKFNVEIKKEGDYLFYASFNKPFVLNIIKILLRKLTI